MNSERLRYREEREIDLFDMFIEVLLHWRGLIIAMIIGGLVLGGYSLYGSYKANASAKAEVATLEEKKAKAEEEEQFEAEKAEEDEKSILELEKKLTETQKVNVESVLTYEKQLIRFENYQKKAVIMKVNPEEVPIGNITIRVIADEERVSDIEKAYEDLLVSQDMYKYISEKCGIGSDISELIGIDQLTYNTESEADTLKLWVIGETEEKCNEMVEAICNHAAGMSNSLQEKLGAHSLSVVGTSVNLSYSRDIYDRQQANQNSIISLKFTIASKVDGFSEDEKAYYELKKSGIIKEADEEENGEEEEIIPTIPPIEINKKKLGIGVIGGLFVYALVICAGYVFNGKLKDSDDFERLCGINKLGKIYREKESKFPGKKLDRAINSLKRRGRKKISAEDAESIIVSNILAAADKNNSNKIAIISSSDDDVFCGRIVNKVSEKKLKTVLIKELTTSSKAITEISESDSAVIIAKANITKYNEVWDTIDILDGRNIIILGGVMD